MSLVQWLSNGGAYGTLGVVWIIAAVGFALYAGKLGRRYDAPNDGCLLGFANQVLLITSGAVGITLGDRLLPFPWFMLTGIAGGLLAPLIACFVFTRRMRRWRPR